MKALIAAVFAASMILAPATAWTDEPPATWDEQGEWFVDCDTATWYAWTIHYEAVQLGVDETGAIMWGDWVEVGRTLENLGAATGDSPDSDCPNWVIVEDGAWVNTTAEVLPPALPLDPLPPVDEVDQVEAIAEVEKVGLAVLWKSLEAEVSA